MTFANRLANRKANGYLLSSRTAASKVLVYSGSLSCGKQIFTTIGVNF